MNIRDIRSYYALLGGAKNPGSYILRAIINTAGLEHQRFRELGVAPSKW